MCLALDDQPTGDPSEKVGEGEWEGGGWVEDNNRLAQGRKTRISKSKSKYCFVSNI